MRELSRICSTPRHEIASVRATQIATKQWGVIGRRQLLKCGLSHTTIYRWVAANRLHRIFDGVYALGHRRISVEGRCWAALLRGGGRAALSHLTAAWWWGLVETTPTTFHVSGPGRATSIAFVKVHHPRRPQRVIHRGLPVTPVARTLRDVAFLLPATSTRRALSEAEFKRLLDLAAAERQLGRGRPGAAALRRELERFDPDLGRTRSPLEDEFLELCGKYGLPPPRLNVKVGSYTVDAVWFEQHLAVELDGGRAHGTAAAVTADRARDLFLRDAGFRVLRYSWSQIMNEAPRVAADLRRHLTQSN